MSKAFGDTSYVNLCLIYLRRNFLNLFVTFVLVKHQKKNEYWANIDLLNKHVEFLTLNFSTKRNNQRSETILLKLANFNKSLTPFQL